MLNRAVSIGLQIKEIAATIGGWALLLCTTIFAMVDAERKLFGVVVIAVIFDLFWGIISALKRGKFIITQSLRETFKKIIIYGGVLLMIILVEGVLEQDGFIISRIVCGIIIACELWSAMASMLIIKPELAFLKILKLQLKGEIERKLGIDVSNILVDKEDQCSISTPCPPCPSCTPPIIQEPIIEKQNDEENTNVYQRDIPTPVNSSDGYFWNI